jgi:serine protease
MRLRTLATAVSVAVAGILVPVSPAVAATDLSGPVLTYPTVRVENTDLSKGDVIIHVRLHLTDETGSKTPIIAASHGLTGQSFGFGEMVAESGTTRKSGWWTRTIIIPADAAPGQWDVVLYPLTDTLGNSSPGDGVTGFRTLKSVPVRGAAADVSAPVGTEMSVSPKKASFVDGPVTVTARVRVLDATGTEAPNMTLTHELSDQSAGLRTGRLASGTAKDGVWEATWEVDPEHAEGEWTATLYPLRDRLGNDSGSSFKPMGVVDISRQGTLTTAEPVVEGAYRVGETLTVNAGNWGPGPVSLSYQWLRDGAAISGAVKPTYQLVGADAGHSISIRVTGTKSGYTSSRVESDSRTAGFLDQPSGSVRILENSATVGQKLTASATGFASNSALTYDWLVNHEVVHSGATWTPGLEFAGKSVTVRVLSRLEGYNDRTATSSSPVTLAAIHQAPGSVSRSGAIQVGQRISVSLAGWINNSQIAYKWSADGKPLVGVAGSSYVPSPAVAGKQLSVTVVSRAIGYTEASESLDLGRVAKGTQKAGKVSVSGKAKVGSKLSAKVSGFQKGSKRSYSWLRNGQAIKGATKSSYKLTAKDAGRKVSVKVTSKASGYNNKVLASKAFKVAKGTQKAGKVSVSGKAKVGSKLSAKVSGFQKGTKRSYSWLRNGRAIRGATKASYKLTAKDADKKISVKVTSRASGYNDKVAKSPAKKIARR